MNRYASRFRSAGLLLLLPLIATGCATRKDIRTLQAQIAEMDAQRAEESRKLLEEHIQSRRTFEARMEQLSGEFQTAIRATNQEITRIGELSGQGYQNLVEMKKALNEVRRTEATPVPAAAQPAVVLDSTSAPAPTPAPQPVKAAPCPPAADAEPILQATRELVRRRHPAIATARDGAAEYVRCYPKSAGVAEAKLLMAETYTLEHKHDEAIAQFDVVVREHPKSSFAPTALYRQGILEVERKNTAAARKYFERIVAEYPKSDEASLASASLRKL